MTVLHIFPYRDVTTDTKFIGHLSARGNFLHEKWNFDGNPSLHKMYGFKHGLYTNFTILSVSIKEKVWFGSMINSIYFSLYKVADELFKGGLNLLNTFF